MPIEPLAPPPVKPSTNLFLAVAGALLNSASQFVYVALDFHEIVVGQAGPFLLYLSCNLSELATKHPTSMVMWGTALLDFVLSQLFRKRFDKGVAASGQTIFVPQNYFPSARLNADAL